MGAVRALFVANRGEIAVRVIRACRELGVRVVVAAEPGEERSLAAGLADGVVSVETYLDGPELVRAAVDTGCDAVHPGYGYLAESPAFAEAVLKAGLIWVGPPPQAMKLLGDKIEARRLAEAAGVTVVPGYAGVDLGTTALATEARRLGPPLLVKAAAGGGGRGMRPVDALDEVEEAVAAARREALAAFGDDRVFLERRMQAARHVEVQLLADAQGHAIHLGERDCSVQRRHQKILEESPSPAVDPELRAGLGEAALAIARAAGYAGAGTAEFLLGPDGDWCFLELNARLQVEHPVTEAVTGIDLVRAQIEIAAGAPLELEQDDVRRVGHAIEARLYAEDPANGFLPATGRIERLVLPHWPGVRVETGVREGDEVGVRFDPLLAKLIAHAEDRDACVERLAAALRATEVLGVTTNLGFLLWTLEHPAFRRGEADTGFVEAAWSPAEVPELPAGVHASRDRRDAWTAFGEQEQPAGVVVAGGHALYRGFAYRLGDDDQAAAAVPLAGGSLAAPMPGRVLRVNVEEGDEVEAGEVVMLLEAMKMELAVSAPAPGTVRAVHVLAGDLVAGGQTLVEVEELTPSRVTVVEVGPRDGLQNEAAIVPAAVKVRLVEALAAAGLPVVEVTSFVSPRAVPQLADADQVLPAIRRRPGVRYPVLVPNMRGMERAEAAGADAIAVFTGASEAFVQANIGMTIEASLEAFQPVLERAGERGMWRRGYVSTAFGCPYQGAVAETAVVQVASALLELGCDEVSIGDTIGVAEPADIDRVVEALLAELPAERLALHLHDTRGRALENVAAGLELGIATLDSSAGGAGGCPFAPGAPGNLATEHLVALLDERGIEHGIDRAALDAAAAELRAALQTA